MLLLTLFLTTCSFAADTASADHRDLAEMAVFTKRIVPSIRNLRAPASGVIGPHCIFYPKNMADVAKAISYFHVKRVQPIIRSGIQVRKGGTEDGTGKIVIDLRDLTDVSIDEGSNKVVL